MKRIFFEIAAALIISSSSYAQKSQIHTVDSKIDSINRLIQANDQNISMLQRNNESLLILRKDLINERNNISLKEVNGEAYISDRNTFIYDSPKRIKSIAPISEGTIVVIKGEENDCYKITLNGVDGWVSKFFFSNIDKKKNEENIKRQKQLNIEKNIADRKASLVREYGQVNGTKIYNGSIWIGMTKEMLQESRGDPEEINRSVYSWGIDEQWVYKGTYVYLENGIVTSWQD